MPTKRTKTAADTENRSPAHSRFQTSLRDFATQAFEELVGQVLTQFESTERSEDSPDRRSVRSSANDQDGRISDSRQTAPVKPGATERLIKEMTSHFAKTSIYKVTSMAKNVAGMLEDVGREISHPPNSRSPGESKLRSMLTDVFDDLYRLDRPAPSEYRNSSSSQKHSRQNTHRNREEDRRGRPSRRSPDRAEATIWDGQTAESPFDVEACVKRAPSPASKHSNRSRRIRRGEREGKPDALKNKVGGGIKKKDSKDNRAVEARPIEPRRRRKRSVHSSSEDGGRESQRRTREARRNEGTRRNETLNDVPDPGSEHQSRRRKGDRSKVDGPLLERELGQRRKGKKKRA